MSIREGKTSQHIQGVGVCIREGKRSPHIQGVGVYFVVDQSVTQYCTARSFIGTCTYVMIKYIEKERSFGL